MKCELFEYFLSLVEGHRFGGARFEGARFGGAMFSHHVTLKNQNTWLNSRRFS